MARPVLTRKGWFVKYDQNDSQLVQNMDIDIPDTARTDNNGIGPMDEDQAHRISREINTEYREQRLNNRRT